MTTKVSSSSNGAASTTSTAQPDALSLLSMALSAQSPGDEDVALEQLYSLFVRQPGNLAPLFPTLLGLLARAGPGLHAWVLRVCQLAFNRPCLSSSVRMQLAIHVPDALLAFVQRGAPMAAARDHDDTMKSAVQVLASVYPLLFRHACEAHSTPQASRAWSVVEQVKSLALTSYTSLADSTGLGAKFACFKLWQRVILVGTRAATGEHAHRSQYGDASLAMIPVNHPFLHPAALEGEANQYLTQIITVVFTSSSCDLVMAAFNTLALLAKARPSLAPIVLEALTSWTPAALLGSPHSQVRNAEKTLRVLLFHFHPERHAWVANSAHAQPLLAAIARQKTRMEQAAKEETARKVALHHQQQQLNRESEKAEGKRKAESSAAIRAKRVRWADDDGDADALAASLEPPSTSASTEQQQQQQQQPMSDTIKSDQEAAPVPEDTPSAPELDLLIEAELFASAAAVADQPNALASFNAAGLATQLVVELTLATLHAIDTELLEQAIQRTRSGIVRMVRRKAGLPEEEEVAQDPLRMHVDDEEDILSSSSPDPAGATNAAEAQLPSELVALEGFVLAPPERLAHQEAKAIVRDAVERIWESGTMSLSASTSARITAVKEEEEATGAAGELEGADVEGEAGTALWSALITRLATRAFRPRHTVPSTTLAAASQEDAEIKGKQVQFAKRTNAEEGEATVAQQADAVRAQMVQFITIDFAARLAFAAQWMAEEWHCDATAARQGRTAADANGAAAESVAPGNYDKWLGILVSTVLPHVSKKDKTLARLLSDVPRLPPSVLASLRSLCTDKERMSVGFTTLRDVALNRPPARATAAGILLELTRDEEVTTRNAAIITVRAWIGGNTQLEALVLQHAREAMEIISRPPPLSLQKPVDANEQVAELKPDEKPKEESSGEAGVASDVASAAAATPAPELQEPTWKEDDVLRYVELPFALCIKVPTMLEEVFGAFPRMTPAAQAAVQQHMAKLIRSLGPTHPTLLTCLRTFPDGAGELALGALNVLMEKEKARPQALVLLVKELVEARDVSPRFLVPIMPDLDKAEIKRYLPRVVTLLRSGTPADRALVKDVFNTVVVKPPEGFGTLSSNLPRARQTSLLQPAELMGLLSHAEMEIGLRGTADAIRICFGMTDVFSSEVIAAVLNQIVEEPNLPTIFMRIALMAISTYKSLSTYVSGNLLTRLITKKIWQTPQLWEGFVICANRTAPASFGALIQLPREQLRDVLQRQPALREGLREYLEKKAGGNRARLNGFLELLGDDEAKPPATPNAAAAAPAAMDSPALSSAPATPIGANGTSAL